MSVAMRDSLIRRINAKMAGDDSIFFLTADLGAISLDELRAAHPSRFVNVGIAEQNLIEAATGLALEGFCVFAYAISPFISMRSYEQIRCLSLMADSRTLNVNLLSLGAGFSYDISGPSHQCVEDLTIIRLLPHVELFSPCDNTSAAGYADRAIEVKGPKYVRLDGKALPDVHVAQPDYARGFSVVKSGPDACIVSTGYATHIALKAAELLAKEGIGATVVDVFNLSTPDFGALKTELSRHRVVATVEEGLIRRGGLDSLAAELVLEAGTGARFLRFGPSQRYIFENGGREFLHREYGMDEESIARSIKKLI